MHTRRDFKSTDSSLDEIEAQWMTQIGAGGARADPALASLHTAYGKLFLRRLEYFGYTAAEAEETAQELWIAVVRAAPKYRGDAPVSFFLNGFLKNARRRFLSDLYKLPALESASDEVVAHELDMALLDLASLPDGEGRFDLLRCVRRVFAAFERDQPRMAKLLLLKHVEEMTLDEIAELLRDTEVTEAQLFWARRKIKPMMAPCMDLWPNRQGGNDAQSR